MPAMVVLACTKKIIWRQPGLFHCPHPFTCPPPPPAPAQILAPEKLRGVGGLLVNAEGRRFVDELATRDVVSQARTSWACPCAHSVCSALLSTPATLGRSHTAAALTSSAPPLVGRLQSILAQPQGQAFLLLSAAAAQQFGPTMGFYASKSLFTKHDSLAAAAEHCGVPGAALAAEVEAYNAAAAGGGAHLDAFGKTVFPGAVDPRQPVYVARITPVVHYTMVRAEWSGVEWSGAERSGAERVV